MMFFISIYTLILLLSWPFVMASLFWKRLFKGKYRNNFALRLGLRNSPIKATPKGTRCLWFHAVSLGETNSVASLIESIILKRPQDRIVFSHLTQTGLDQAVRLFGERIDHLLLPADFPWYMKDLLERINPEAIVFVESDWWPNLVWQAHKRGTKVFVVNATLSPASFQWYRRLAPFTHRFWSLFDRIAAQSEMQVKSFQALGITAEQIRSCGNMKLARRMDPDPVRLERLKRFFPQIKEKSELILLASSHPSEEKLLIDTLRSLAQKRSDLYCIIAPRHTDRCKAIAELLADEHIEYARWSEEPRLLKSVQPFNCLLLDSMGCMNEAYSLSSIALVGGTWREGVGGHNFLEPVMAGVPTFYGPHVFKQPDFHLIAKQEKLAFCCTAEQLPLALELWINDKSQKAAWQERLGQFQQSSWQSVDATLEWLWPDHSSS